MYLTMRKLLAIFILAISPLFIFSNRVSARTTPDPGYGMEAQYIGEPEVTPEKIKFKFIVMNTGKLKSWGIDVYVVGFTSKGCTYSPSPNFNIDDPNNSFGYSGHPPTEFEAECTITTAVASDLDGDMYLDIYNDGEAWGPNSDVIIGSKAIQYDFGFGSVSFDGYPEALGGNVFKFKLTAGPRAVGINTNLVVSSPSIPASWNGGGVYNCPEVNFPALGGVETKEIQCDFNQLSPGNYNIAAVLGKPSVSDTGGDTFDTTAITIVAPGQPPVQPGGPGGPPIVPQYSLFDLNSFFGLLQNIIIAIAVVSGIFIIPYAFILMASGNPEKIKQGTEWLKSILWGYLVVFLAATLIRFVGSDILSLGI